MSVGSRQAVTVVRIESMATSVRSFELRAVDDRPLPAVEPGAHLSVHTPAGMTRTYSIAERTAEGNYVICVARNGEGRGGSVSMHDDIAAGDIVSVSPAANSFPLVEAPSYLLIAGGIGITVIRAIFRAVVGHARVRLLYLARSRGDSAYVDELEGLDGVTVHYSAESGRFDLWTVLQQVDDRTHLYYCAGEELAERVRLLTMHWRPTHVHFEDFAGVTATAIDSHPFEAVWVPDGDVVEVDSTETLLSALRRAGKKVDSSCESGTCGTCVLQLLDGEVAHRDLVLGEAERSERIISCVSRAALGRIAVSPPP